MKRTVAQAERWYEDAKPVLSLEAKSAAMFEINKAKAQMRQFSDTIVQDIAATTDATRSELLQDLCEVRDGYAQLAKDGKAGKLTSQDFIERMNRLEGIQASATKSVSLITQDATSVETIEEDPVAYADNVFARQIQNQYEFSF